MAKIWEYTFANGKKYICADIDDYSQISISTTKADRERLQGEKANMMFEIAAYESSSDPAEATTAQQLQDVIRDVIDPRLNAIYRRLQDGTS